MLPRLFLTLLFLAATFPTLAKADDVVGSRNDQQSWRTVGLISGGTGLMFLAGAAAYKSGANSDHDAAHAGLEIDKDRLLRGEERGHTAVVLGVVGATALVGGVLAYYVGGREKSHGPKAVQLTPVLVPTSGQGRYSGFAISAKF
jgi:hypothetical protein